MIRNLLSIALILAVVVAVPLLAGKGPQKAQQATKAEQVTMKGTLVCLGCDLNKAEGARAACPAYGHKHALKTADGKYINFLENQYSADLIKGEKFHNKQIEVHGLYYANANQLDVEDFTVAGKKMSWCGHCKGMDGCMARKSKM